MSTVAEVIERNRAQIVRIDFILAGGLDRWPIWARRIWGVLSK